MSKFAKCPTCNKSHGKSLAKTVEHYDKCVIENKCANLNGLLVRCFSIGILGIYYMYAIVGNNCTFADLDKFLKQEWCDCGCNHLSQFIDHDGNKYSKKTKISTMGLTGKVTYEYDMGNTTTVFIELCGNIGNEVKNKKCANVFSQSPIATCKCKQTATLLSNEEALCETCAKDIDCDETPVYHIENTPRTGMCGYCLKN